MRNDDSASNDKEDQDFHDELHCLRQIEIPPGLKADCLAAAASGLARARIDTPVALGNTKNGRFIFPAAIAASLFVGTSLGWIMRGQSSGNVSVVQVKAKSFTQKSGHPLGTNATSAVKYYESTSEKYFYTEETYLCGVGRIMSKSQLQIPGESP